MKWGKPKAVIVGLLIFILPILGLGITFYLTVKKDEYHGYRVLGYTAGVILLWYLKNRYF